MEKEKNNPGRLTRKKIMDNRFYPLIILVIVVLVSVSLVMVIGSITKAKIIAERDAEVISQLQTIFPRMEDHKYMDQYYEIYQEENVIGYAFTTIGKGYGGDINILIGINKDYNIQGVTVLSNNETPGLGTKITESSFTDQFKGLGIADINLSQDGGEIDAITGATISSKGVTDAVKGQMEIIIEEIKKNK